MSECPFLSALFISCRYNHNVDESVLCRVCYNNNFTNLCKFISSKYVKNIKYTIYLDISIADPRLVILVYYYVHENPLESVYCNNNIHAFCCI